MLIIQSKIFKDLMLILYINLKKYKEYKENLNKKKHSCQ